jgi:hypothetical protein
MSELPRLVDDSEADPELARLFRAGRPPAPLSSVAFGRSRRRVLGLAAAPAALSAFALIQKAALGAVVGMAAVAAVALPQLMLEPAAPSVAPTRKVAPGRALAPPSADSRRRAPSAAVAALSAALASSATTSPPPPGADVGRRVASSDEGEHALVRESRSLERARAELERRPALCLQLLLAHARAFPQGALLAERELLTVASLMRLGRRSEAQAAAQALRARSPGSLYEERLESLLGEAP